MKIALKIGLCALTGLLFLADETRAEATPHRAPESNCSITSLNKVRIKRDAALRAFKVGEIETAEEHLVQAMQYCPESLGLGMDIFILFSRSGQHKAARWQAKKVLAKGRVGASKAAALKSYLSHFEGKKTHNLSLAFALQPSSNLNRGSAKDSITIGNTVFMIDEASRQKPGLGVSLGLTGWKEWDLGQRWAAHLNGAVEATFFRGSEVANTQSLSAALKFTHSKYDKLWSVGPVVLLSSEEKEITREQFGMAISFARQLDDQNNFSLSYDWRKQEYPSQAYRDGHVTTGKFKWQRKLKDRSQLEFYLPFGSERTQRKHLDHRAFGAGLLYSWFPDDDFHLTLGAEIRSEPYVGNFPGLTEPRKDSIRSISVGISNQKLTIAGGVPRITYTYTTSDSNVALYKYQSHDISIGVIKGF